MLNDIWMGIETSILLYIGISKMTLTTRIIWLLIFLSSTLKKFYSVYRKYCPPWPEKMDSRTIKVRLDMKRYIQYDSFESKIVIVKCVFLT